jgi:CheY-like chemotaxis protein
MMADETTDPRGRFLATLNHEVRTPLSGILGMADLLLETTLDDEQRDYVQASRLCAENLLELLNETLEYSALLSDRVVLDDSEFCVLDLLESVAGEFECKARSKGLRLVRSFQQDVPEMACGDAVRLRQILAHLLTNAIKFTLTGYVELAASASPAGDDQIGLRVSITDTGIGIAEEELRAVFESFRQLDTGLARRYAGLGLGLSLAQKITSLMHGEVSVVSSPGKGSTFTVDIPLRAAHERRHGTLGTDNMNRRILVVEDNPVAQTITMQALRKCGFEADCASSGKEAVAAAGGVFYDLVLMDLQMPEMDGFQTTAAIRSLDAYRNVPIIALTANSSTDYRDLCVHQGFDGFLSKPIRSKDLIAAIERYLDDKRQPSPLPAQGSGPILHTGFA